MSLHIPAEQMEKYKRTARERQLAEQRRRDARREHAWELAHQAADLLKREYGVQRVVAFGSLIQPNRFTASSDVDLAAWGLTPTTWLKAIGAVHSLSSEIELNLVDVECCSPELLAAIERDGVPL
ncbi:MAG TPA: nucleotidyltransferase domain-containing protein [Anaerolineae bacterium]